MSVQPTLTLEQTFELRKLEVQHNGNMLKLQAEQAFEREKMQREERFMARHEYARQLHAERLQFERNFKEYGQLALRSVFVLNAGAIVVLLAFVGSSISRSTGGMAVAPALFKPSIAYFSIGLGCVVAALIVAYANYQIQFWVLAQPAHLTNNMMVKNPEWPRMLSKRKLWWTNITWIVSIGLGVVSGGFLILGAFNVLAVFGALK